MSPTHWEVTDVDDINLLNPLQILVSVCGQVRFCDSKIVSGVRLFGSSFRRASVGAVLLAVRYGKYWTRGLDDLSDRRARLALFRLGSTTPLGRTRRWVMGGRRSLSGKSADATHRLGKVGSKPLEACIDTEVGLT